MSAIVSQKTAADVQTVVKFFGIDMTWSRHIFSHAAQADGRAFETTMGALAAAIRADERCGILERARGRAARERAGK